MGGGGMFLGATAPLLRSICNSATLPSKVTKLHFFLSFWFAVKYFIFWVTSLVENFWLSTTICICGLWIRLQTPDSESRLQTLNQTQDSRLSIQSPDSESDSRLWIQTPDCELRLRTLNPDSRLWIRLQTLNPDSRLWIQTLNLDFRLWSLNQDSRLLKPNVRVQSPQTRAQRWFKRLGYFPYFPHTFHYLQLCS